MCSRGVKRTKNPKKSLPTSRVPDTAEMWLEFCPGWLIVCSPQGSGLRHLQAAQRFEIGVRKWNLWQGCKYTGQTVLAGAVKSDKINPVNPSWPKFDILWFGYETKYFQVSINLGTKIDKVKFDDRSSCCLKWRLFLGFDLGFERKKTWSGSFFPILHGNALFPDYNFFNSKLKYEFY